MKHHFNNILPLRVKAGYSLGEASSCITVTLLSVYGMFFLTDIVKISPAVTGIIVSSGVFFSAFCDPVLGIYSDNLIIKWGRRRPLILISALPQGILLWLFFTKINFTSQATAEIYYFIIILLCFLFNSLLETPHLALSAEMTQNYDERTRVMAWRSFSGQIGSILGGPVAVLLFGFFSRTMSSSGAISFSTGLLGITGILFVLISWHSTTGTELFYNKTNFELKSIIKTSIFNKSFVYITTSFTLVMCVIAINSTAGIYYLKYTLHMDETQISIIFFILFGAAALWIPVIEIACLKFGKKTAWLIFIGMWAIVDEIYIQWILSPEKIFSIYLTFFFIGGGFIGVYMIGWSMISDCIEIDEFKTGIRREGMYFGVMNFIQKIASSFVIIIIGIYISMIGYEPDIEQTPHVQLCLKNLNGSITAIILFVSIVFCWLAPINRKKYNALKEAILLKESEKQYDISGFKDIL